MAVYRIILHLKAETVYTKATLTQFSIQSKIDPFLEAWETLMSVTCKHEDLCANPLNPT